MFWRAACMMVMFACVAIDARHVECRHCGRSVGRSSRRLVLETAGRDEGDVDVEQLAVISRDGSWNRAAGGLVWGGDSGGAVQGQKRTTTAPPLWVCPVISAAPPVTHLSHSITRWGLGELASGAWSRSAFGRRR
ncbi:hypothetical protein FPV67DRAFT_1505877, partial [Lyophyllum atratum]